MSKKKVILGLSGGVDSAVAAIRLLEEGYEVEGLFMRNWDSSLNKDIRGNPHVNDSVCPQEIDYLDALESARILGIKLHRVDFVQEYWDKVFTYFLDEYRKNRTPNPDILCNKEIKFKCFLEKAFAMGADYIAMGHYARVRHHPEVELLRGVDPSKDQSYFLCQLSKEQLSKTLFPIGDMHKGQVRELAKGIGSMSRRKDSTGFVLLAKEFQKFLKGICHQGNMEPSEKSSSGMGTCTTPSANIRPRSAGREHGSY